jgi:hypothetical protein
VVVAAAVAGGGSGGGSGGSNSSGSESGSSGGSGLQRRRWRRWQRQRHDGGRGSGSGDVGGGGRGSGGSSGMGGGQGQRSSGCSGLFPHTGESVQMKKNTEKFYFYLRTTNRTKRIWTEYLASPDLEQSLTKSKKKLRQAANIVLGPFCKKKKMQGGGTILRYDFMAGAQIVPKNRPLDRKEKREECVLCARRKAAAVAALPCPKLVASKDYLN